MEWPTEERPGRAIIAPTVVGTFGIWWRDFEAMENRGGYSGPYGSREEAEDGARSWAEHFESPLTIEHRDVGLDVDDGLCAVVGCEESGRAQVCFYDGRYHRHGYIHYEDDHPFHPDLKFKSGPWRGVCDPHYAEMKAGAKAAAF